MSILASKPTLKKRPLVATIEQNNGARGSSSKRASYNKSKIEAKIFPPLPPLFCSEKKGTALLKYWIKNKVIWLPEVESLPTVEENDMCIKLA